eukprot:5900551-Pyramimonas_sp.AAC.1
MSATAGHTHLTDGARCDACATQRRGRARTQYGVARIARHRSARGDALHVWCEGYRERSHGGDVS